MEHMHAKKLEDVRNINDCVRSLLSMEPRIRLCEFYGDIEDDKGFFITKEHIFIPYVLPMAEHDIAHLVELKSSARWTLPDWGMPRFDGDVKQAPFFAALAREIRTRAIQLHISTFLSKEHMLNSTAYNQFNNSYWRDQAASLIPFGRFRCFNDLNAWMCDLRDRTNKAWSYDRIRHEWEIRLNHIRNWMETQ